ncbi:MAG TPA: UbiA-like protein EboC [Rhodothermales bacterium]
MAFLRPWLTLARPANVVTAWADVLAGLAVASIASPPLALVASPADVAALLFATTGLYAGGVTLNDVFDAHLDASERPDRPIPSGKVVRRSAAIFGAALLAIGIVAAFSVNTTAGLFATFIAVAAVAYDAAGKKHPVVGPLNMGACRAGNLLMGVAAVPVAVGAYWYLAAFPLAYIAAVTAISRGEVHGGTAGAGRLALVLVMSILLGFVALAVRSGQTGFSLLPSLPFLLPFVGFVLPAFVRAARRRDADSIRRAVRTGVLFLILLDASVAAGFGGLAFGVVTAALLPVSLFLARLFAVT